MLNATQWVKVPCGASGSSMIRASDRAVAGTSMSSSGGDRFSPYWLNRLGIMLPFLNSRLWTFTAGNISSLAVQGGIGLGQGRGKFHRLRMVAAVLALAMAP